MEGGKTGIAHLYCPVWIAFAKNRKAVGLVLMLDKYSAGSYNGIKVANIIGRLLKSDMKKRGNTSNETDIMECKRAQGLCGERFFGLF